MITVPWFSNNGEASITATAQKTDGGSATLSLTVNRITYLDDAGNPTTKSTTGSQSSVSVNYEVATS